MIDTKEEQIKILCKQLKLPTFANYADILRQSQPGADFSDLLLELLMSETAARQENQTRRRLKAAAFPYQKTLDEFDFTQLNESVSPVFIQELKLPTTQPHRIQGASRAMSEMIASRRRQQGLKLFGKA